MPDLRRETTADPVCDLMCDLMCDPVFEAERSRLLGIVYRMTGSYADAEDAVQDVWLRWRSVTVSAMETGTTIERPAAWLTTAVSRLALDKLRSAAHRRETYVGPWLPEPVRTGPSEGDAADPGDIAVMADSLRLGFLLLLDRLAPVERVVLLMADVFAVPFAEIAATVDKTPEACRQIASRARRQLRADGPSPKATSAITKSVVEQFVGSLIEGDLERMISLSSADLVLTSDGGRDHRAARRPIVGPHRVARFLVNIAARWTDVRVEATTLNGDPAIVLHRPDAPPGSTARTTVAIVFEADDRVVRRVLIVANPDKLVGLGATVR